MLHTAIFAQIRSAAASVYVSSFSVDTACCQKSGKSPISNVRDPFSQEKLVSSLNQDWKSLRYQIHPSIHHKAGCAKTVYFPGPMSSFFTQSTHCALPFRLYVRRCGWCPFRQRHHRHTYRYTRVRASSTHPFCPDVSERRFAVFRRRSGWRR